MRGDSELTAAIDAAVAALAIAHAKLNGEDDEQRGAWHSWQLWEPGLVDAPGRHFIPYTTDPVQTESVISMTMLDRRAPRT